MMKVLQSVFVLVLWTFSWSAFAGVYDINIAGSFDDLVATNGEYHLDGLCSKGDMYGYEISLFTENQMVVDNIITNAKIMGSSMGEFRVGKSEMERERIVTGCVVQIPLGCYRLGGIDYYGFANGTNEVFLIVENFGDAGGKFPGNFWGIISANLK